MRSSRLVAMMLRLQLSGFSTARELAAEFEVSTRTVLRDVEALQGAGLPIWTTVGSGGGIHLDSTWSDRHLDMTADETVALLVDDQRAIAAGLGPALHIARSRVRSAAPPGQAELLSWIDDRFLIDPTPWFQPPVPTETPACLSTVAIAVRNGRRLDIVRKAGGKPRRSRVDPYGIVVKHGIHYLVAAHRRQLKTYRIGRINSARLLDAPAVVPDGFDLGDHWSRFVSGFEATIRPVHATIRVDASDVDALRRAAPGPDTERALLNSTHTKAKDTVTIDLTVEQLPIAAAQLCSIPSIKILKPSALRDAVVRHAEAIAHNNGRAGSL